MVYKNTKLMINAIIMCVFLVISAKGMVNTQASVTNPDDINPLTDLSTDILDQVIENKVIPVVKAQPEIPINIVFLGTNQSYINEQRIDDGITKFSVPTISMKNLLYYNANYTISTHYYYSTQQMEQDYVDYLNLDSVYDTSPWYLTYYYDAAATNCYYFSASNALQWLSLHAADYFGSAINNGYTMFIIDTYTDNYIPDYYYYHSDIVDADTGLQSVNNYTNYFGGNNPSRSVFLDLSAGPVYYKKDYQDLYVDDNPNDEGVSDSTIIPIWQYDLQSPYFKGEFADQINEYVQETIDLVFLPSYLYVPEIRSNFDVEIVLFDDASVPLASWVDLQTIYDSFTSLLPYYNLTVNLSTTTLTDHSSLQQVITSNSQVDTGTTVIDTEPVVDYLKSHQSEFGVDDNSFPVYIFGTSNEQWFTDVGVLGVGQDDGNGNPEMVIMGYPYDAGNPWEGYTATIIHEVGHLTSLRHPHDGISWDRFNDTQWTDPFITDWLPDFISTPMTYANPDTSFSTFDIDQLNRGYTLNRINATWWTLATANVTMLNKDYTNLAQTSTSIVNSLQSSLNNLNLALKGMSSMNFHDAFDYANQSYYYALSYLDLATQVDTYVPPTTTSEQISSSTSNSTDALKTGSNLNLPYPFVPFFIIVIGIPILRKVLNKPQF